MDITQVVEYAVGFGFVGAFTGGVTFGIFKNKVKATADSYYQAQYQHQVDTLQSQIDQLSTDLEKAKAQAVA